MREGEVGGEGGRGDYLREGVRRKMEGGRGGGGREGRRGEGGEEGRRGEGRRGGGRHRGTVVCSIILENATVLGSRTRVLHRLFYIIVPIH